MLKSASRLDGIKEIAKMAFRAVSKKISDKAQQRRMDRTLKEARAIHAKAIKR